MPAVDLSFIPKFQPLWRPNRYKIIWGGRGGAKSWTVARMLLAKGTQQKIRVLCLREFQKSIAESVYKLLENQIQMMGLSDFYTLTKTSIRGANGTEFFFEGLRFNAHKIKSYEDIDYAWVEQAERVSKGSWEILRPTMRKSGSEIWIIVNPELEDDYTYQEFIVHPPEGAVCIEVNWKDNPHLSDEALAEKDDLARKDPDAYLNIWEGKCRHALDGAIYAKELRDADGEARITRVPYNHGHPVHTGWDLGHSDHTSIWFIQRIGYEHHIIDFYQNNAEKVGHYLEILQQRKYLYGNIYLPHDANSELLAGNSIKKQVELEYPGKVIVVPRTDSIVNDINAVRTMFPNFYFDKERCAEGLHCLRHYRYGVDDTTGRRSRLPLHDFASDAADALRTFAVGFKPSSRKAKPQRQGLGGAALSWMGL